MQLRLYRGDAADAAPAKQPPSVPPLVNADDAFGDDTGMTARQLIAKYLESLQLRRNADDLSDVSLVSSRRDLERFATHCGDRPAAEIRTADLTEFLLANPQWRSNATKRRVMAEVIACWNWAATEAVLIPVNLIRRPKRMKLPVKPRREAKPGEYIAVMRAASRELRRALFFLRRSGARTCEMREACWDDVLWDEGIIQLWRHKTMRVTGEPRLIGLEPCVLRFLRNLHRQAGDQPAGHVFLNVDGTPWTANAFCQNLRRTLQRIGQDEGAGKRLTGYMLRHHWCGNASENNLTDRQAADGMGQKGTQLVSYYSKARQRGPYLRQIAAAAVRRKRG